ncbi:Ig-like domain-containing protein [Pedobacter arcticus]|uniref:Ig-like domain-containing protein n=1 Tax=Pedobacter arcticus TaxID=752140 RepID=UPI0012B5ED0D|nr:Ig-like domain-containing protein [Pedobacter arcticus]
MKKQIGALRLMLKTALFSLLFAFLFVFNLSLTKAQVCGTSGLDGPQNAVPPVNTYFPLSTGTTLIAGSKSILLNAVPPDDPNFNLSYGVTPIKSGDLILLIQMQDASFNYTNSNLYGSGLTNSGPDNLGGTGFTNLNNSGKFEYVVATSNVPITGGTLKFRGAGTGGGCFNSYTNSNATGTAGQKRFQVIRVPQYSNLVLTANITTPPYNGSVGGLIAFDVAGTMQFNGFVVDASERGFRGGYGDKSQGSNANNSTDYVLLSTSSKSVGKGEGVAGTPKYMWDGFNRVTNPTDGLPAGSYGRGAPANGGGGGNDHNSGGGGGGNGGYGGLGGAGWQGAGGNLLINNLTGGGRPGSLLPLDYSRLVMGGGGGGGDANNAITDVKGGVGGGIVIINVDKIAGVGVIRANGGNGEAGAYGSAPDGAGGGGAGGSIFVRSLASSPGAALTLEVRGGKGGNTKNDTGGTLPHGPGGGGGGGVIYTQVPSATINSIVTKGNSGKTNNGNGINHGAMDGTVGIAHSFGTTDLPTHLQGGGSICYPRLTTTLKELNPGSAGARSAGSSATYTLTIENEPTNGNAGNVEAWFNLPSTFKVSAISYTLTGDAAGTLNAAPHIGASGVMSFGNFNISPGDKVTITINVNIEANAPTGIYHASAQATYLDPTRTTFNPFRKITGSTDHFTGSNFTYETGGVANVIGTNYNGDLGTSIAEDVHINALAAAGFCDAITGGGFETYTVGGYTTLDKWNPVNSGEVVKIANQNGINGAVIKNKAAEKFSLQQTVISIEPATAYTLTFNYRNWDFCGSPSTSKIYVEILDGVTGVVIVPNTQFNAGNSPDIGTVPFVTLAGTTSLIVKFTDAGSPNPACGTFLDHISIVSNLNITYPTTNITCNGAGDGKVTIKLLSGAAAPYRISYSFNGGTFSLPVPINPIDNSGTPLVFPDLLPGTYLLKIVDANGCENIKNFSITEPPVLSLSESHINNVCYNNSIGAIDLTVTGGTSPYTYFWTKNGIPTEYAATEDISNLTPGNYTVTVTDKNSCQSTLSVDILPLMVFKLAGDHVDNTCFGNSLGSINLVPSGGKTPYSFTWSNGSHDQNQVNLPAGTYSVIAKDGLGCEETLEFIIAEPEALLLSTTLLDIKCYGESTGAIDISVSGGTLPYTYAWDNGSTTEDLTGLKAGAYQVTVTDANGCEFIKTITITEPASPLAMSFSQTDVKCYGESTGAIDISVTGGTLPYTYVWDNGSTTEDLTGLKAGAYQVTVTDANGCEFIKTITITEPASPLAMSFSQTDVKCYGESTGAIDISVTGGTLPYTYVWDNGSTTEDLTGLKAGAYQVTVTDANGCEFIKTITITEPASPLAMSFSQTDVKCYGESTGAIDISVTGGTLPYTYVWDNGSTTEDLTGLKAGAYQVTVTDANGCEFIKTITITEPASPLAMSFSQTDVKCYGETTGAIDISVTGGTAPYTYVWDNGKTDEDLTGLKAGAYQVTVTDANGCEFIKTITLSEPASPLAITFSQTDIKCYGESTGAIEISVSGGTSPYTYAWDNGKTDEDLTGLKAGAYKVTVTDANGCEFIKTITLSEPASPLAMSFSQTDIKCYGESTGAIDISVSGGTSPYTYVWDNGKTDEDLTGLKAGAYRVTVTDANGCEFIKTITLSEPTAPLSMSFSQTDVKCYGESTGSIDISVSGGTSPYTYAWDNGKTDEDLTGLKAGAYRVTVTDANGCEFIKTITLSEPTAPLSMSFSQTDVKCYGESTGSIDISVSGGTSPYTYAWDNGKTDEDLTGLKAGAYQLTITDANGCELIKTITLIEPASPLSTTFTQTDIKCYGESSGAIDISVSGGTLPYTYAWDNGKTDEDLTGLKAGDYKVTITDANGCELIKTITLSEPASPLSTTFTQTDIKCYGESSGAIDISVSGGTSPYTYAWDNGSTTEDLTGLKAGVYQVTITDANGCEFIKTIMLSEPVSPLAMTFSQTDIKCYGESTGAIDVSVSGGTSPYTYAWDNGKTDEDLAGLKAGDYKVTITDANGCELIKTITLSEPASPLAMTFSQTDIKCYGESTGAIDVSVSGGTSPYTYAWDNGSTTEDLTGLKAGDYKVTITDANGCELIKTIPLNEPVSPLAMTFSQTDIKCYGESSGAIDISVSGGTLPYTYAWDNGKTDEDLTGLKAGDYKVTITDANGCELIKTITLSEPVSPLAMTFSQTDIKCYGESSGAIDISVSGGTLPYTYAWDNGKTDEDLTGLKAGDYKVTITDANGCELIKTITLSEPASPLSTTFTQTDIKCYGESSGAIDISVSGGTSPYTYAWDNGSTTEDLTGLKAGDYKVTVTDANGCELIKTITLSEPTALRFEASKTEIKCYGETSTVTLTTTGGIGTYVYSKDGTNFQSESRFENLPAGDYNFTVKDANNCIKEVVVKISQPQLLSITETHESNVCYAEVKGKINLSVSGGTAPYQYQWNNGAVSQNIANLPGGIYSVVVTDKNGCNQTLSVEILPLKPFVILEKIEQIKCFGENSGKINLELSGGEAPYQVSWSNGASGLILQNLAPGNYTYVAKDALGCLQTKTINISQPRPLSVKTEVKNTTCKYSPDGAVKLIVSGGTQPYKFIWNGTDRGLNSTLLNVNAGRYNITVIDANNCTIQLSAEVLPGNCAPSADNDRYETKEDTPININAPAGVIVNDTDPDDDELRVSLGSAKDPDGETGDVDASTSVFKTKNGKVILNKDGSFTYIPNKNFFGTEYFIYEVTDGELKSNFAQVTIVVTPVNDSPVAVDDFFSTAEDTPINGSVATNDYDPDNDPLTYIVTNPPASGTLTLNADGTFIYIPAENFNGTVTFGYQVSDPRGLTGQATVTIVVTPVNDAPIAGDDKFSIQRNGQITETVTANDSDPDGDLLQFTKLTNPTDGVLTFNPDGTFVYKPNNNFKGIDHFTYQACDPFGLCDSATVTLVVQPLVTVHLTPKEATIKEGDSIKITAVLTESLVEDVTIYLSYSGTAEINKDYILTDNYISMIIPANQTETTQYFTINTILDDIKDDNETIISNITSTSKPTFVNIGDNATVIVKDVYPDSVKTTPSENPDINPDPLISPNGDGLGNESFIIYNITKYPNNEVMIFNRWGNKVYQTRGYDNKGNSFKGIANVGILTNSNKELVDGVYYYIIYTDENSKRKMNKGYLILKR